MAIVRKLRGWVLVHFVSRILKVPNQEFYIYQQKKLMGVQRVFLKFDGFPETG